MPPATDEAIDVVVCGLKSGVIVPGLRAVGMVNRPCALFASPRFLAFVATLFSALRLAEAAVCPREECFSAF